MGEEEENPNSIDILPDLLEEVFLRLPTKSILKCRTVSKQWRSILESKRFAERHMSLQKSRRKILAAYNCDCGGRRRLLPESRFEGDEEIVYLHCDASRPSMTCQGLVCFPEQDWIIVLNPSTRQLRRFSSGLNDNFRFGIGFWKTFSPLKWAMGFGREKVNGRYKVVRMSFSFRRVRQEEPVVECGVLDVDTGEWRKLSPPPYKVDVGRRSACVNGSIYWLHIERLHIEKGFKILALDLHKEEFHDVSVPAMWLTRLTQLVNLEGRLAIAKTTVGPGWILEIWSMDTEDKRWSKTYSINLAHRVVSPSRWKRLFTPVAVSKQGNLVFKDNQKRLFKYYPGTDEIRCLSLDTCVISPYLENLVALPIKPSHPHPRPPNSDFKKRLSRCRLFTTHMESGSWIYKVLQKNEFRILDILFTSLVVVGYIWIPL
ncbi:F-box domain [Arabidopsis thaliana x Arabidopsis arenosa]|uniref:F-box domain n=1 Tax=Arabidopsis thaliana x Arabidopsis arenosa TaxID=1240361 RepID=A0A8T2ADY6_9BRAS|nr:F-box domain [Arabidopsis thaliana x Arabidopsis arenosa]